MEEKLTRSVMLKALRHSDRRLREKAWYRFALDILTNNPQKLLDLSEIDFKYNVYSPREMFDAALLVLLQHDEIPKENAKIFIDEFLHFKDKKLAVDLLFRWAEEFPASVCQDTVEQLLDQAGNMSYARRLLHLASIQKVIGKYEDVWLQMAISQAKKADMKLTETLKEMHNIIRLRKGDDLCLRLLKAYLKPETIAHESSAIELDGRLYDISFAISSGESQNLVQKFVLLLLEHEKYETLLKLLNLPGSCLKHRMFYALSVRTIFEHQIKRPNPVASFCYQVITDAHKQNLLWAYTGEIFGFLCRILPNKVFDIWQNMREQGKVCDIDKPCYIEPLAEALKSKANFDIIKQWEYICTMPESEAKDTLLRSLYENPEHIKEIFSPLAQRFNFVFRGKSWETLHCITVSQDEKFPLRMLLEYLYYSHFDAVTQDDITQICSLTEKLAMAYGSRSLKQKACTEMVEDLLYWGKIKSCPISENCLNSFNLAQAQIRYEEHQQMNQLLKIVY